MKYGDTLHQRSIPEWEAYNVDYNDIKRLIKVRTTKTQSPAKSIAGHSDEDESLQRFEEELYTGLYEQHQRIDLFVKSKSGEITRRLNHLKKQTSQTEKQNRHVNPKRISVRCLERASKVEEEVLRAGQEIQLLSRFVGAQRLAFQKLLKKYRKWTGSQELARRFTKEVIGRQTSFVNTDFDSLLHQWTDVLVGFRVPFESTQWAATSGTAFNARRSSQSSAKHAQDSDKNKGGSAEAQEVSSDKIAIAELDHICRSGTDSDLDTALAVLPLGKYSGSAVYWVHSDNIVGLHVLLLQYMKIRRKNNPSMSNSGLPSPRVSRKGSMNGGTGAFEKDSNELDELILCYDLHRYVKQRNGEESNDSGNTYLNTPEASATIRVTSSGEAVVAVGPHPGKTSVQGQNGSKGSYQTLKVKRKALGRLFDIEKVLSQSQRDSAKAPLLPGALEYQQAVKGFDGVQEWLRKHETVQPLVQIQRKRTRYFGLKNNEMHGIWSSLDQDISMRKLKHDQPLNVAGSTIPRTQDTELEAFPYAVLEVRWEGGCNADVIQALNQTHLTERVDGFALETHAIFTLCKPKGVPSPFWLPALEQDIRKLPPQRQESHRQNSQTQQSSESANTQPTSMSANSIFDTTPSNSLSNRPKNLPPSFVPDLLESASLSAYRKEYRHSRRNHPLHESIHPSSRYWNEYDDPSTSDNNSTYHIFIDPDASTAFPGWRTVTDAFHTLSTKAKVTSKKVLSRFTPYTTNEHRPLLSDHHPEYPTLSYTSSHTSLSSSSPTPTYKTFPSRRYPLVKAREKLLLYPCIASFFISYTLLLMFVILAATCEQKAVTCLRHGTVVGVVFSVLFTGVGVGCEIVRRERRRWVRWWALGLLVVGVGVGWVLLTTLVWGQ